MLLPSVDLCRSQPATPLIMGKRRFAAWVSDESYAGWERFAAEHGMTMAAAAESLGLMLGTDLPARIVTELEHLGRQVTAERRSRRKP